MQSRTITREQARELDRRAVDEYGMISAMLMENAGRGVADKLCQLGIDGPVVICCGPGNNGGDGLVIARHLDLRSFPVIVLLWPRATSRPAVLEATATGGAGLQGDAALNYRILSKSDVPIRLAPDADALAEELRGAAWIVDALLGTGSRGEPRSPLDQVIDSLNDQPASILAVDLPSGLDCNTGQAASYTIRARHTCTFVAPKPGFYLSNAEQYTGQVHVVDIGAPRKLVEEILSGSPGIE